VPIIIDKIEVFLDFYICDIMDFDLLLGFPLDELLDKSQGILDHKLREYDFSTSITGPGPPLANPFPKQDPLEKMMYVSPFSSSEPVLIKILDFPTPHENDLGDSLNFCEGERSSSLSTEFEPLSTGSYLVAFDQDSESISNFNDKSLKIDDSWIMKNYDAPTLEFIVKDSIDEHGSFILEIPY
jgi:hypothetical protein